jgi:2'-5' RNA ligase
MLIIFSDIRAIVQNLSWQTKQSIPHTTVIFYGDRLKMCEDFAPNFDDERTGCCITTTHRLTLRFFTRNNMTFVPHLTLLKGRHFDTIELIEAESQAVLNTLTEHSLQIAFKNVRSAGNGAYALKGTTSRVMVASRL